MSKPDLSPPWIIFSDKGKPVAILPAGRPGEVANVKGLSMALVRKIVTAANQEGGGSYVKRMESLTARLEALRVELPQRPDHGDDGGETLPRLEPRDEDERGD